MTDILSQISKNDLETMMEAAQIVSETMRVLQKSETNIIAELLSATPEFYEWEHIPAEDVYDRVSHSQYYYHAHSKSEDGTDLHDDEHGHFHTFIRGGGFPAIVKPANLPDYKVPDDIGDINTHLIGVGMDHKGVPIRLFTVNRWVTAETWCNAEDVIALLDSFEIDDTRPSWAVNLWLTNMMKLYRPQIEHLIIQRDKKIKQWLIENPDEENAYENRELEVTSHIDINLSEDIQNLEKFYALKASS